MAIGSYNAKLLAFYVLCKLVVYVRYLLHELQSNLFGIDELESVINVIGYSCNGGETDDDFDSLVFELIQHIHGK